MHLAVDADGGDIVLFLEGRNHAQGALNEAERHLMPAWAALEAGEREWLFDFDSAADRDRFPEAVMRMFSQEKHTRQLVEQAQKIISGRFGFFSDFLRNRYSV